MNVTLENDPYKCGITIKTTGLKDPGSDIDELQIKRSTNPSPILHQIFAAEITDIESLSMELFDLSAWSERNYYYYFDLLKDGVVVESWTSDRIRCEFDGLFVGNLDQQYVAVANVNIDVKRNTESEYVQTLNGRTPYKVSNSNLNYATGSVSGMFLELTNDKKKFKPDTTNIRSRDIVNFLTDGTTKILKTNDGRSWYVSIDDTVSQPSNNNYQGMVTLEFDWTEIDEMPFIGMVVSDDGT